MSEDVGEIMEDDFMTQASMTAMHSFHTKVPPVKTLQLSSSKPAPIKQNMGATNGTERTRITTFFLKQLYTNQRNILYNMITLYQGITSFSYNDIIHLNENILE